MKPITVITGLPGDGKTLRMIQLLNEAAKDASRPIFAAGIDGLAPGLAEPLDDPRNWQECPDNSIIFVDEAWKWFGHLHDARQAPTPKHVLALAEVRHRGISFVMTTQMVNQLYPFMRGLVGPHIHVVRHMGMGVCTLYTWPELNEDVKSHTQRERAVSEKWVYPKSLFHMYKSATSHSIKRSIPWRVFLIPTTILAAVLIGWLAFVKLHNYGAHNARTIKGAGGVAAAPAASDGDRQPTYKTAADWQKALTPLLPGLPYTAPIFAGRKPVAVPRTFCMIAGADYRDAGSSFCRCKTEQGTSAPGISDALCRVIAVNGYYDPYLPPVTATQALPTASPTNTENPQVHLLAGIVPPRETARPYQPPNSAH
jgi:zona occludens toxin (predicted ATPase)